MTDFESYCLFLSLWMHFTKSGYNHFTVTRQPSSPEKFAARKDRYAFGKLAKKFKTEEELTDYLAANFVYQEKDKIWIYDFLSEGAVKIYQEFKARKQSLGYIFTQELLSTIDEIPPWDEQNIFKIFRPSKGQQWPAIVSRVLTKEVSLETLIICDDIMDLFKYWEQKKQFDDYYMQDLKTKCTKFKPFINYNRTEMLDKFKQIKDNQLTSLTIETK